MKRPLMVMMLVIMMSVAVLSGCINVDKYSEDFDAEYDANANTLITVFTFNGDINVVTWSEDKVDLHAVKTSWKSEDDLKDIDIEVTELNDTIEIEAVYPTIDHDAKVSFTIKVPSYVRVSSLRTSNGDIQLTGTKGNATVSSSNGDVTVKDVDGFVGASSSNGDVKVTGTSGVGDVSSSNGKVEVEVRAIAGDTKISSSNGRVIAHIDQELNADLTVRSSNGDVDVHDLSLTDKATEEKRITGKIGTGGPDLEVYSSNGDVDVHKL